MPAVIYKAASAPDTDWTLVEGVSPLTLAGLPPGDYVVRAVAGAADEDEVTVE